jgi:hypothetical protein
MSDVQAQRFSICFFYIIFYEQRNFSVISFLFACDAEEGKEREYLAAPAGMPLHPP